LKREYKSGKITAEEFKKRFEKLRAMAKERREIAIEQIERKIKEIKERYKRGELSKEDTKKLLLEMKEKYTR